MQGKRKNQESLFTDFRLSDRIPKEKFYRCLRGYTLLWDSLPAATARNLKKWLKFTEETVKSGAGGLAIFLTALKKK